MSAAGVELSDASQLTLFTILPKEAAWRDVQMTVGGIHRLEIGHNPAVLPNLIIYWNCREAMKFDQIEQVNAWQNVQVFCIKEAGKRQLRRLLWSKGHKNIVWFHSKYIFEPAAFEIKRAEMLGDPDEISRALVKGRAQLNELLHELKKGSFSILSGNEVILEAGMNPVRKLNADFGLIPRQDANPSLACHVVLKREAILNGAQVAYPPIKFIQPPPSKRLVAIGVPTTSHGMSPGEPPVFLKTLLPSLLKTLLPRELEAFQIVVFVGFDAGDGLFDDLDYLSRLHSTIPPQISLVFLRLKPLSRVAMTWNMIFAAARRLGPFEYFYQVNDDLTMITSGWLTNFTRIFDANNGYGVVGPSDNFNGFSCSLLTQAIVTERHFQLFSGLFYPLEFKDWKSDRWLSFVYGNEHTHCFPTIVANNGAKGTRYTACPFESWRVVLKATQQQINVSI